MCRTEPDPQALRGRRIGALDFGDARIGFAVCDPMHITCNPRGVFANDAGVIDAIRTAAEREELAALVVGRPFSSDGRTAPIEERIEEFVKHLREELPIPVIIFDESFSTRRAFDAMRAGGARRKKLRQKGRKDEVAAAVILRDFLDEVLRT